MFVRRIGLALGVAVLVLGGSVTSAAADNKPPIDPLSTQGCKNGKYWEGGITGWRSWAHCFIPGGHDFYAFAECREGYTRKSIEYPTNGKYTAWTRGGCPTVPRKYGQYIVN